MAKTYSTLISVSDLAANINNPQWVILDCRHDLANPNAGRHAFAEGHLPSAQFAHLDLDLSGNKISEIGAFCGRHPLPDRDTFINKLRSWGINNNTQVIAYDASGGMYAARLWWMMRWVGHEEVAVLDGGIDAWKAAHQPLTTAATVVSRGTYHERESIVRLATVTDVLDNIQSGAKTLVDARSPDRYRGENETLDPVGGHIPGAKNRFFKDNLNPDGTFKSAKQLQEEWDAIVPDSRNAIMQCGSGVTACHNLLAMENAGLRGAMLYAGSWSEWCMDPRRPTATGN